MEEGSEYMLSLLKRMDPEYSGIKTQEELHFKFKEESKAHNISQLKKYIKNWDKHDTYEENSLRAFWENIYRHHCGKLYYEFLTESFTNDNPGELHRKDQKICMLSLLDTTHHYPQEAKSRMPTTSIDGSFAANFGYKMGQSKSYQNWISNPLIRASGDIIVDALLATADFGSMIDVQEFTDFFKNYLEYQNLSKDKQLESIQKLMSDKYYSFVIPFMYFILEDKFNTKFIEHTESNENNIIKQLKKVAIDKKENLEDIAKKLLQDFKDFSTIMLKYRPTDSNKETDGMVFGIGFNGKIFDASNHLHPNKNEVWLTFSKVGRSEGVNYFSIFYKK